MKKIVSILLLVVASTTAIAQQDPQYSMYMFNGLAINPAYSGSLGHLSANALYRTQWLNIDGAPTTLVANVHSPFANNKVGAGLSFTNDQIGVMARNQIAAMGSYHLQLPKYRIAFGLQLSYNQYQLGLSNVQTNNDGTSDQAFATNINTSTVNFGTGIFFYGKNWFIGAGVPQMAEKKITDPITGAKQTSVELPHVFINAGFIYAINPMVDLKPSVLLKTVSGMPLSADINVNAYYQKRYGVGFGYRHSGSMIAMLECQVHPMLKVAYAYDRAVSNLGTFAGSTHEILLRFDMVQKGSSISPRLY